MNETICCNEAKLRRELVRFSRWLSRLGFTPGTSGNLSTRLDEERILVTPTGVSKGLIKAADMVIVDLYGKLLSGTRRVTSEIGMHLVVYEQRANVRAVVHAHPAIATALACSGRGLEEILCQESAMTLGSVPLARYATTGTAEVPASLRPYLQEHDAILLENHGAVSYGRSLEEAFMRMETLEHLAQVSLAAHQFGSPRPLTQTQLDELRKARINYHRNSDQAQEVEITV